MPIISNSLYDLLLSKELKILNKNDLLLSTSDNYPAKAHAVRQIKNPAAISDNAGVFNT
jgi:hypothetical protein